MPDEGAVALQIVARLMIHLTGKAFPKNTAYRLLADVEEDFLTRNLQDEARIVRELAEAIDHSLPDDPHAPI